MLQLFHYARRLILVCFASAVMALNINSFVHAADLFPGGFTGLTLLLQEIFARFFALSVPFSVINLLLNSVPVFISFKFIGPKFTIYSCIVIILTSLFTDCFPSFYVTDDVLLAAVFGGFINACAVALCLFAGATSGGTDFIAIFFSEKYGRDVWNYILIGNAIVLVVAGYLFGWNRALYSIFFQFTSTQALKILYRKYQKLTMLIVTSKSDEIYRIIRDTTHHDATLFKGVGCYEGLERDMLYSVVSADEVRRLTPLIQSVDKSAFINVLKSQRVNGRFYQRPKD